MAGDTTRYINALQDECGFLSALNLHGQEANLLGELSAYKDIMTPKQKNSFLWDYLIYEEDTGAGSLSSFHNTIKEMTSIQNSLWLNIAYLYLKYCEIDSAKVAIGHYEEDTSADLTKPVYHMVKYKIAAAEQNYLDAFFSLSEYNRVKDSLDLRVMQSSAPYAEESIEHQIAVLRNKYQRAVLILLLMLAAFVIYFIKERLDRERRRNGELQGEKDILESEARIQTERIEQANQEIAQLNRILSESTLSKETRQQVDVRLAILNKYVAHQISETSSPGGHDDLQALLSDRKRFLSSMTASFTIAHPMFVKFLKDIGMNEREAGCCCLYCIGLRGSEIASYLELSEQSYYNFSSRIRKKLGLDSYKTNINTVLKEKLVESDNGL